jgi:hypothetical protein
MSRRSEETEELVPLPVDDRTPLAAEAVSAGGPASDRAGLDRSGRALGLGALLLGLVVAGALTGIGGDRRREASFDPPAPPAAVERRPVAGDELAPEGWRRGAPGPFRHRDFAAQVWTGTELVVWGGDPPGVLVHRRPVDRP